MANVRPDRKLDRGRIELPGGRRAADPARIFQAGVSGDLLPLRDRTARKESAQAFRELGHVLLVDFCTPHRRPLASALARVRVGQALALRLFQRGLLDENALPLVSSSRPAKADNDCIKRRVLPGAARERRVPTRQKHEVIEVGAGHAERPLLLHAQEAALPELGPAFYACRLTQYREHDDVGILIAALFRSRSSAPGFVLCRSCHGPGSSRVNIWVSYPG